MSCNTRGMYDLDHDEAPVHNEFTKGRQKKDPLDEDNLISTLLLFNMFANNIYIRLKILQQGT